MKKALTLLAFLTLTAPTFARLGITPDGKHDNKRYNPDAIRRARHGASIRR